MNTFLSFDEFIRLNGRNDDFKNFANGKDKASLETRKAYLESLDEKVLYRYLDDKDDFIVFIM